MTIAERPLHGAIELQRYEIRPLLTAGFESAADRPFGAGTNMTYENTLYSHSGSWRLRANAGTGGRTAVGPLLAVVPGKTYQLSVWARRDDAFNGTTANSKFRIGNAANVLLSGVPTYHAGALPAPGTWYQRTANFTVPDGVTSIRTSLVVDHTAGLLLLDDVSIVETEPSWHPAGIANALQLGIRRGGARTGLGLKTDVGIMSFQLLNAEDPMAGGTFQPGQQLRAVSRDQAGQLAELFTGRVVDVASSYPLDKATGRKRAVTTVTVADAVKVHGETPRYGVTIPAGFETFEARISRLAGSALAPVEAPAEGAPREVYAF